MFNSLDKKVRMHSLPFTLLKTECCIFDALGFKSPGGGFLPAAALNFYLHLGDQVNRHLLVNLTHLKLIAAVGTL